MGILEASTTAARRREAATKRKEAAAESKQIRNQERKAKLADRETRRQIRKQRGGAGVTVTFYDLEVGGKKYKVRRKNDGKKKV